MERGEPDKNDGHASRKDSKSGKMPVEELVGAVVYALSVGDLQ